MCKSSPCRKCNQRHNTLLHLEKDSTPASNTNTQTSSGSAETPQAVANISYAHITDVLLPTALVYVRDYHGNQLKVRILLDSGSQSNFIRKDLVQQLQLKGRKINFPISGINKSSSYVTEEVTLTLHSRVSDYKCRIVCLVLPNITDNLPQKTFSATKLNIPNNINLADPNFSQSDTINILVGAEMFWSLICPDKLTLGKHQPILQRTHFGWIISGPRCHSKQGNSSCLLSVKEFSNLDIQQQLYSFWQQQEPADTRIMSPEETECENFFNRTTIRNLEGRFVVRLPFKTNLNDLGESYDIALKRFSLLERKLTKNETLYK